MTILLQATLDHLAELAKFTKRISANAAAWHGKAASVACRLVHVGHFKIPACDLWFGVDANRCTVYRFFVEHISISCPHCKVAMTLLPVPGKLVMENAVFCDVYEVQKILIERGQALR